MKWISVKERLPEKWTANTYVVLCKRNGYINYEAKYETEFTLLGYGEFGDVEYWMPLDEVNNYMRSLPKPPSENAPSPGSETSESDNLDMALKKGDHCDKCGKGLCSASPLWVLGLLGCAWMLLAGSMARRQDPPHRCRPVQAQGGHEAWRRKILHDE